MSHYYLLKQSVGHEKTAWRTEGNLAETGGEGPGGARPDPGAGCGGGEQQTWMERSDRANKQAGINAAVTHRKSD